MREVAGQGGLPRVRLGEASGKGAPGAGGGKAPEEGPRTFCISKYHFG